MLGKFVKETVRQKLVQTYITYELIRAKEKKRYSAIRCNARKFWIRPIFIKKRIAQGASNNLVQEMIFEDREKLFNYF